MLPHRSRWLNTIWILPSIILCAIGQMALAGPAELLLTNICQLEQASAATADYRIQLEGSVWWSSPVGGTLVVQDGTGAAELETGLSDVAKLTGARVRLTGNSTVTKIGWGYQIGFRRPVVDNNGVHEMVEKSGSVFLKDGWQPIQVDWFNGVEKFGLEVEFAGPNLLRQKIPSSALFKREIGTTNFVNGLNYICCATDSEVLPDFEHLVPLKTGSVENFDLSVIPRNERIGVRFNGCLKVPEAGLYTFYITSDDGSRLFVGESALRWLKIGRAEVPSPQRIVPGQILGRNENCFWAQVEGAVSFASERTNGLELELSSGPGRMLIEIASSLGLSPSVLINSHISALGVCLSGLTVDGQKIAGRLLVPSAKEIEILETNRSLPADFNIDAGALPTLTTCAEVHRLKREEAQRGYPVQVCGVVTCVLPEHQAFTIQDATRGIYAVDVSENGFLPQLGQFLKIVGVTDPSLFAPIVNARQLAVLGAGHLPEAVRPTWDQLMNGSLDAQYVELQGIVIAVNTNGLTLLTRDGRIKMELRTAASSGPLDRYEDALVRVRGCLFANWDYVTHEVKAGEIRIYGADLAVDQPAPADLFSLPEKSAAELLLFDPQASVFQRVKVSGQILCQRNGEYFMTDGHDGLRFIPKKAVDLKAGDSVHVVGFPELSGAAPLLREAMVVKTGHATLPPPKVVADDLLWPEYDAIRVRVGGLLVSQRATPSETVYEIQNGVRTFFARLAGANNNAVESLAAGSKLELTGVYAAQGGNKAIGQNISAFELLLDSPADVRVLARPPWWTLERLLYILGALACVLAITVLWITQLHRKVEARSAELELQIHERQRVEQQRTMEQERARIAQDLHDELGSGLTEVSMLGARARGAFVSEAKRKTYLEQMGEKAQAMVAALDEIVWAMNPRHDSLDSLISYFSLYADHFLGLANIAWRLEDAVESADSALDSQRRHQLFLAFKEALSNVVRHAGATEVRLSFRLENGEVWLSVADNGRGLPRSGRTEAMDGIANMRARLEKVGGRFEIHSHENQPGVTVCFHVPAK